MEDDWTDPTAAMDLEADWLQKQMAYAQALRGKRNQDFASPQQAMSGRIGNVLSSFAGIAGDRKLRGQMSDLLARKGAAVSPEKRQGLELTKQRMALQAQQLADAQRGTANATAPVDQSYVDVAKEFGFALPAGMTKEQAAPVLDLMQKAHAAKQRAIETRLNREAMAQTRADTTATKATEKEDAEVKDLADDLGKMGAPTFVQGYNEAKGIIDKNPDDLPGYGQLAGMLPDSMVSDEGKDLRQSVGQMLAEYRKGVTGSGMSDSEKVEFGQITGLLKSGDETSVRKGVERLMRARSAQIANRAAGSPKAAETLAKRQPYLKQALEAAGGGQPARAPTGSQVNLAQPVQVKSEADYAALPSGAEYIDPSGKRKRKK